MKLHTPETTTVHRELFAAYKERLDELEAAKEEEQEEPFERSFLHNAIHLHTLWFEQLTEAPPEVKTSDLLEEILKRRESDIGTFQKWMNGFAQSAKPNGWAVWGWSYPLKTFVGCPIRSHDNDVPIGVTPLLVIDCWEHSYMADFGTKFEDYLERFWTDLNWQTVENRHKELMSAMGFGVK